MGVYMLELFQLTHAYTQRAPAHTRANPLHGPGPFRASHPNIWNNGPSGSTRPIRSCARDVFSTGSSLYGNRELARETYKTTATAAAEKVLYIVGLGLGDDERGVTVRGLDAVRRCARVYMEARTALLTLGVDPSSTLAKLEKLYGKEVTVAGQEMVVDEERGDRILREAAGADVAFLVVGHPFGSDDEPFRRSSHTDLVVRAKKTGIQVKVIDSASVVNGVGVCGLQLHRYGAAITIPFFTETWKGDHFYQSIVNNRWMGHHTLCLLDVYVKEPISEYLMSRGNKVYEPPRFMTVNTAIGQLLEVLEMRGEPEPAYDEDSLCIGVARLGSDDEKIVAGPMGRLVDVDFGPPPHCLVIVGETNQVEEDMLEFYMIN